MIIAPVIIMDAFSAKTEQSILVSFARQYDVADVG